MLWMPKNGALPVAGPENSNVQIAASKAFAPPFTQGMMNTQALRNKDLHTF